MEVSADELRQAVERLHLYRATFRIAVPVLERFEGEVAWDGVVHVFDLTEHPSAKTCFAWSSPIKNSVHRQFYAVLKVSPILSASDAVRAAILKDYRNAQTTNK